MAGGPATTAMSKGERAGKQVGGDREAAEELELALAESCGLRAFGCDFHMHVIIHAVKKVKPFFQECENRKVSGGRQPRRQEVRGYWLGSGRTICRFRSCYEQGSVKLFV
jgi:hypothetical protein